MATLIDTNRIKITKVTLYYNGINCVPLQTISNWKWCADIKCCYGNLVWNFAWLLNILAINGKGEVNKETVKPRLDSFFYTHGLITLNLIL